MPVKNQSIYDNNRTIVIKKDKKKDMKKRGHEKRNGKLTGSDR